MLQDVCVSAIGGFFAEMPSSGLYDKQQVIEPHVVEHEHTACLVVVSLVAISVSYAQRETAAVQHFDSDVIIVHARCFWVDAGEGLAKPVIAKVVLAGEGEWKRKYGELLVQKAARKTEGATTKGGEGGGGEETHQATPKYPFCPNTFDLDEKKILPLAPPVSGSLLSPTLRESMISEPILDGRRDEIFYHTRFIGRSLSWCHGQNHLLIGRGHSNCSR